MNELFPVHSAALTLVWITLGQLSRGEWTAAATPMPARFLHPHERTISQDISGVPGSGGCQQGSSDEHQILDPFIRQAQG